MIESISIANVATYGSTPQIMSGLCRFNYVFGANATGKTTISRIVADAPRFPSCKLTWRGGTAMQTMVYNQDFIDRNFNQSTELKGVFTMGEQHIDTLRKITNAKAEIDAQTAKIETFTRTLQGDDGQGGKRGELAALESDLNDKCWAQKKKHDATLQGAFEGYRGSEEKFKGKILQEHASNVATLLPLTDLERKAASIFGSNPVAEKLIPNIDTSPLVTHEAAPILKKVVVGKDDVDVAAMIKRLGNSDWVRQGRPYYEANGRVCPFCQQQTTDAFAQSLNEYFDESFLIDSKAVTDLADSYAADAARVQRQLSAILAMPNKFLDVEKLKTEQDLLASKIAINMQRLAGKKTEPSRVVDLESHGNVIAAITTAIAAANKLTREHNAMVANLSAEKRTLTAQVWKFVLEELKVDLAAYSTKRAGLDKAIAGLTAQTSTAASEKARLTTEMRALEKTTTSVQPTVDTINDLLRSFGFNSFSLSKAVKGTSYKMVRGDGSDAKATLSEGERSFVTFLYFYHLLRGSDSESGMTTDRIVVFDDPVSSFDSDILFIVGSLIKELLDDVRSGKGHVKQVFVLTHNVYFHKEVTFNPRRPRDQAMGEETFWIVRRPASLSMLERHPMNPIKTSYELLWSEVRNPNRSKLTIQNTLRRILENYFKILGGVDLDRLCVKFEGKDRLLCKSLCSWVHDGSHYAHDDFFVAIDDAMVDAYLRVFREIFEKHEQIAHYNMMMGEAARAETPESPTNGLNSTPVPLRSTGEVQP